jgi:hypothetical protein
VLLQRILVAAALATVTACAENAPRPLLRDFIGLCGHTVQFRPELYRPVAALVRDYHPIDWDFGKDSAFATKFPLARNGVDWSKVYGSWTRTGFRIDASVMFDNLPPATWRDLSRDAFTYGKAVAQAFGPSSPTPLLESIEIGNEPGKYSDAEYRTLFEAMARGAREGDPRLIIATCAANLGPSGRYSKSVDLFTGLESLYDVVNIHIYAEIEGWPTWRRSFPEDGATRFLAHLRHVLTWRREHAPAKQVWLTEFGWDASTKPAPKTGDFARWQGSTETQQAQWIVRAWLLLAREEVDRAYLYFFNDSDEPHVHGSSGLTRNFVPKPAYHASVWLQRSLGDYRFKRVLRESVDEGYAYEFASGEKRILATWRPSGETRFARIPDVQGQVEKAERMPLSTDAPEVVTAKISSDGALEIEAGESPVFVWLH